MWGYCIAFVSFVSLSYHMSPDGQPKKEKEIKRNKYLLENDHAWLHDVNQCVINVLHAATVSHLENTAIFFVS